MLKPERVVCGDYDLVIAELLEYEVRRSTPVISINTMQYIVQHQYRQVLTLLMM
jgi:hypothetical protein